MLSDSMESPRTLSLTVGLNSYLRYGNHFARVWGQLPVSPLGFTHRPMAKLREPTKTLSPPSAVLSPRTQFPGALSYLGLSTHTTPWLAQPQVCPLSKPLLAISHLCFLPRKRSSQYPPSNIIYAVASLYGKRPKLLWRKPQKGTNIQLINTGFQPHNTLKVSQFGCPLKTSL